MLPEKPQSWPLITNCRLTSFGQPRTDGVVPPVQSASHSGVVSVWSVWVCVVTQWCRLSMWSVWLCCSVVGESSSADRWGREDHCWRDEGRPDGGGGEVRLLFRLLLVIMHSEMMSLSGQLIISDKAAKVKPPLGPMFPVWWWVSTSSPQAGLMLTNMMTWKLCQ